MSSMRQLSIMLPEELVQVVTAKISSGEYASESEMIGDGLRRLVSEDLVYEDWLVNEVGAAYDEVFAEPSSVVSMTEMREALSSCCRV